MALCFILGLLAIVFVKTGAVCSSVEAILNLDSGSVYKSYCDTASSDGHLINFTTSVISGDGVIALITSAADCSKELSSVYYYRGSCNTPAINCSSSKYTTASPVCLIIYNPMASKQQLYVKVTFSMPEVVDPLLPNQFHLRNTGQYGGTPGQDINVSSVWAFSTGQGIVIDIVDDGLLPTHQDIQDRVRVDLSYDYQDNENSPLGLLTDGHGTACAGLAASGAGNFICGKGVAYNAQIAAHRILFSGATSMDISSGLFDLLHGGSEIDVSSNSWGPWGCDDKSGCEFYVEDPIVLDALSDGITYGRNGKGRVYVFAGGNEGDIGGDVNQYPICKLRTVICVVGSGHNGTKVFYSNPGAAILVNAPTSGMAMGGPAVNWPGMTTLSVFSDKACMDSFGGTSGATPVVAGVIALVLQVRPDATWRDVQHILLRSAYMNDPNSSSWFYNAAGWHYSRHYGYGRVDAYSAVTLAKSWELVTEERQYESGFVTTNLCLPDHKGSVSYSASTFTIRESGISKVETVAITVNILHNIIGDVRIYLTSPENTTVLVVNTTKNLHQNLLNYTFYARCFYGENANGNWTIKIADTVVNGVDGRLQSWNLHIWGTGPGCSTSHPCPTPLLIQDHGFGLCHSDLMFDLSLDIAIPVAVGVTVLCATVWCCVKCRNRRKRGEKEKLLNKTPKKKRRGVKPASSSASPSRVVHSSSPGPHAPPSPVSHIEASPEKNYDPPSTNQV